MTIYVVVIVIWLILLRVYFRGISLFVYGLLALPFALAALIRPEVSWLILIILVVITFLRRSKIRKLYDVSPSFDLERDQVQRGLVSTEAAVLLKLPITQVLRSQIIRLIGMGLLVESNEAVVLKARDNLSTRQDFLKAGYPVREVDLLLIEYLRDQGGKVNDLDSQDWLLNAYRKRILQQVEGYDMDITGDYFKQLLHSLSNTKNKTSQDYYDPGWRALKN